MDVLAFHPECNAAISPSPSPKMPGNSGGGAKKKPSHREGWLGADDEAGDPFGG